MTDRLYGLPGAEYMQGDLATVYEQWADDRGDYERAFLPDVAIEEWTVRDPADDVKNMASWVAEAVAERVGESDATEEYAEAWWDAAKHPEVIAGFEVVLARMASKVTGWRMADRLLATHLVTHVDGEPFLDGKPLFPKVAP